ncbi:MAG TPA: DoxX family protein [Gemmatimonadaceae bacterium]|nr:DoxX family protein [Gemmatimonadaceae bacterium]
MPSSRTKTIAKTAAKWLPAILLVLIFAPQGWTKFSDTSGWAEAFRHWGYPDWFRVLIGVMEVSAALLLLSGRGAIFGAMLVICVMLGAAGTKIVLDNGRHLKSEIVPTTLSTIVLVLRRDELKRLIQRLGTRPSALRTRQVEEQT